MKKLKPSSFVSIFVLTAALLFMNAISAYSYEISSDDSDIKIDKFQPSTGLKIKTSPLAQAMENATYNATHKGQPKRDTTVRPFNGYGKTEQKPVKRRDTSKFRWY